jgi:hypothetical protein
LSRSVQVVGAAWRAATRTMAGVGDLVQRTGDGRTGQVLGVARRSRGWVAPCAIYTWHVKTRSAGFLVEPQNQGRQFVSGLAPKPLGRFSLIWPQNWWRRFLGLGLKTGSSGLVIWASKSPRRFLGLDLKTKQALVCRLRHKTDRRRSTRDTRRDLAACLAWKQVWLWFPSLV